MGWFSKRDTIPDPGPKGGGPFGLMVVGLGNPGRSYARTRHNVGFMVVDRLAERLLARSEGNRFQAELARAEAPGKTLLLVKPQTFMNLSGEAVVPVSRYFKIPPEHCLVVVDDCDLPFGKLRIRLRGSAGSHNGLKSIEQNLGRGDYPRLRVGIGQKPPGWDLADYVLSRFQSEEERELADLLDRGADAVLLFAAEGATAAMNRYNADPRPPRNPDATSPAESGTPS